ncbi:MAG: leucyl/phenylalanyl-tRNA--protein transferase [Bacteroidales bacterium]|nr:leucyl/phenylalanyl-tRNA--protein transferase [Bacteroidales bacterium]
MSVYLLPEEPVFPPACEAESDGLIAIGGDLSVNRLLAAYSNGIFPWFIDDDDIFWFSPDPRMVLFPENFKVSESLRRIIQAKKIEVRFDTAFNQVIEACSKVPRPGQDGTWISPEFITAYKELHIRGYAHSVEAFSNGKLAGGLYGLILGHAFFGESMFFSVSNASKVAMYHLAKWSLASGIRFIDCQVESEHLSKLGASLISRQEYLSLLEDSLRGCQPETKRI